VLRTHEEEKIAGVGLNGMSAQIRAIPIVQAEESWSGPPRACFQHDKRMSLFLGFSQPDKIPVSPVDRAPRKTAR